MSKFDPGAKGEDYQVNKYTDLSNMIGTIAFQVIRENTARNPLSVFDKMPIDNGDTIEEAVLKLVEASPYDKTGTGTLDRITKDRVAVRLYSQWEPLTFEDSIDLSEIRKVLLTGKGAEDLASKLVGRLGESDIDDKFQRTKGLLKWGTTNVSGEGKSAPILKKLADVTVTADGKSDYKGILKQIKDTVKGMQYMNADFNTINLKRRTRYEDIRIIMPYTLIDSLDVDELAGVFNLSKAEISTRIIETDSTDKYIYIVDQNAILCFTRLYQMLNQLNAKGRFWNYFLHVERLYGICPLFDCCFFEYDKALGK